MKQIPIYDETAPIACSLDPDAIPGRLATIDRMRMALDRLDRTEHGLLLHFPAQADLEAELRAFAVDEKRCCPFWGFAVLTDEATGLALRWDGPPRAAELVERLERFFAGDEPVDALSDLL
jgi:hypothetical protein